jgi:hypothetical protein
MISAGADDVTSISSDGGAAAVGDGDWPTDGDDGASVSAVFSTGRQHRRQQQERKQDNDKGFPHFFPHLSFSHTPLNPARIGGIAAAAVSASSPVYQTEEINGSAYFALP